MRESQNITYLLLLVSVPTRVQQRVVLVPQALPQPANRASSRRTPAQQASEGVSMNSLMGGLVSVQPHALDSHVPALCGPLQAGHPPPLT